MKELSEEQKRLREWAEAHNPYDKNCPNRHLWNEGYIMAHTLEKISQLTDNNDMIELVKAYDEYVKLLAESEGNLAVFASTHGITVDDKLVERGKELRQKITELKTKLKL